MSDLTGEYTLLDLKAMHDPNGNVAKVIDTLSEINQVMSDAIWVEANDLTSHVITQALEEGDGETGVINQGVQFETDNVKQIREQMEMYESYSRVDERLVKRARKPESFRAQKDAMRLRGMAKGWHTRFFYGTDDVYPENVRGLATRYNDVSLANVHDNGDTSNLTSMWVVQWGAEGCHLIYPRGDKTVIEVEDLGKQLITDSGNSGVYTALVTHYMLNWGIGVSDDRAVQRVANVETGYDPGDGDGFNEDLLIYAISRLPDPGALDRVRIYVNRDIKAQMDIALKDKQNVHFTKDDAMGGRGGLLRFNGIPIRMVDKLTTAETQVT